MKFKTSLTLIARLENPIVEPITFQAKTFDFDERILKINKASNLFNKLFVDDTLKRLLTIIYFLRKSKANVFIKKPYCYFTLLLQQYSTGH